MRKLPTVCLILATACLMGADKKDILTAVDKSSITGKWEVVSAQRDGKPQHGQVGREKGDVITIGIDGVGPLLFG